MLSTASPPMLPDVAFYGKAGAGKTTAASLLGQTFGYERLSFAAPLKRIASDLWGAGATTDRGKLQRLGVAVRDIEADTWVRLLLKARRDIINDARQDPQATSRPTFVVDDLRFPNEYWALREAGFVMVRVSAPVPVRIDRLMLINKLQDVEQLDHQSETALDSMEPDVSIENGTEGVHMFHDRIYSRVLMPAVAA